MNITTVKAEKKRLALSYRTRSKSWWFWCDDSKQCPGSHNCAFRVSSNSDHGKRSQ